MGNNFQHNLLNTLKGEGGGVISPFSQCELKFISWQWEFIIKM